jgi:peptidoglycan/LPS O-acetylase OafA/YrhL
VERYRPDIDGLRGLSILLVVTYHAGVDAFAGGFVAVDVFFVISGFLITGLLLDELESTGRIKLRAFLARRVRRLLPLAALVLTTTMVIGASLVSPLDRSRLFDDVRASALFVANWHQAGQAVAYSDATATSELTTHWWSLAVEEQFYLVWPMMLFACAWLVRRWSNTVVSSALLAVRSASAFVVVTSFLASVILTDRDGPQAYYYTHTRLWELGAGALLATYFRPGRGTTFTLSRPARESAMAGGVVAIVASTAIFDATTPFPGSAALLPVVGASLIVGVGSGSPSSIRSLLSRRPVVAVGRWSYGWYLWHWPAIGLFHLAADEWASGIDEGVITATALVTSLGLAAATYRIVENPIRRSAFFHRRTSLSLALGAVAVAIPLAVGTSLSSAAVLGDDWTTDDATTDDATTDDAMTERGVPLVITPAEAADDKVDLPGSDECHARIVESSAGTKCVFGDPDGAFEVVLIGDSHAQHWLPALDELGKSRSWRIHSFTKSACPIFDVPLWNNRLQRRYTECATWHGLVAEQVAQLDDPVVVLANASGYSDLLLDDNGRRTEESSEFADLWRDGARRGSQAWLAIADRIIRLADTPWAPEDVPGCLSKYRNTPSTCDFVVDEVDVGDDEMIDVERSVVSDQGIADRYVFVDPSSIVCPDDPCRVVDESGIIVYRDFHHLTQTFSQSIADDLGELIVPLVESGR